MRYISLLLLISLISACGTSRKSTASRPHASHHTSTKSKQIASEAHQLIGSLYKYGGESPRGFDCSGLVFYVYRNNGVQMNRISNDQSRQGSKISLSSVKAGDLLFFGKGGRVDHVGIVYTTKGKYPQMIHSSSSKGVILTDVNISDYWRKRYLFATRVL